MSIKKQAYGEPQRTLLLTITVTQKTGYTIPKFEKQKDIVIGSQNRQAPERVLRNGKSSTELASIDNRMSGSRLLKHFI